MLSTKSEAKQNHSGKYAVAGLLLLAVLATAAGCTPSASKPEVSQATPSTQARPPALTHPGTAEVAPPTLERLGSDGHGFSQAVVVGGHPLVYTRQLFPVDQTGQLPQAEDRGARLRAQAEKLAENLRLVLAEVNSDVDKLVRVHGYVTSAEVAAVLVAELASVVPPENRPALTLVETPLPLEGAEMAMDAVAIAGEGPPELTLQRCKSIWGEDGWADVAVIPPAGFVYFSGHPERGEAAEAIPKAISALFDMGQQLGVTRPEIVQVKVFAQPIGLAETVKQELRKAFSDQLVPPAVFVEWIAPAPIEIEMVAVLRSQEALQSERIRFYNPPGVKPSPTFTRVVLVGPSVQIFTGGLIGQDAGDGAAEVRSIFAELEEILKIAKSDLRHLAKATYYVSGKESSAALDKLRPEYFDSARPPAASKVTVHGVAVPERTITVDMIAVRP